MRLLLNGHHVPQTLDAQIKACPKSLFNRNTSKKCHNKISQQILFYSIPARLRRRWVVFYFLNPVVIERRTKIRLKGIILKDGDVLNG